MNSLLVTIFWEKFVKKYMIIKKLFPNYLNVKSLK
jgi:hypothetical protein